MLKAELAGPRFGWTAIGSSGSSGRDTADPLGLRAWGYRVARGLVPALTSTTTRVRGFSLCCAGVTMLRRVENKHPGVDLDEVWLRMVRCWTLAQTQHYLAGNTGAVWPGRRRAESLLLSGDPISVAEPLLQQEMSVGLWGSYRTGLGRYGLTRPLVGARRTRPSGAQLTSSGTWLAAAATRLATPMVWDGWYADTTATTTTLAELGDIDPDRDADDRECGRLADALRRADVNALEDHARLREVYDAGQLALATIPVDALSSTQRASLVIARHLADLVDQVERPYRSWLAGENAALGAGIATHPGWAEADPSEDVIGQLVERLRADGPTLTTLHAHAAHVARLRGADPVERHGVADDYAEAPGPDFLISAARSLFSEGYLAGAAS